VQRRWEGEENRCFAAQQIGKRQRLGPGPFPLSLRFPHTKAQRVRNCCNLMIYEAKDQKFAHCPPTRNKLKGSFAGNPWASLAARQAGGQADSRLADDV